MSGDAHVRIRERILITNVHSGLAVAANAFKPSSRSMGGHHPRSSRSLVIPEHRGKVRAVSQWLCCLKCRHDRRNPDFSIKFGVEIARSTRSGSCLNALFGYHCSVHC
jgi:hypothetical protein